MSNFQRATFRRWLQVSALALGVFGTGSAAAAPVRVPYTGTLQVNNAGDVAVTIQVKLFDSNAQNATLVWPPANGPTALYPGVQLRGGRFSITLGDTGDAANPRPALEDTIISTPGRELWLDLTVTPAGGQPTVLRPRQRLLAVPYAVDAGAAQLQAELARLQRVQSWYVRASQARPDGQDAQMQGDGVQIQPIEIAAEGTVIALDPGSAPVRAVCAGGGIGAETCANGAESIAIAFVPPVGAAHVRVCTEFRLTVRATNANGGAGYISTELDQTRTDGPSVIFRSTVSQTQYHHMPDGYSVDNITTCAILPAAQGDMVVRLMRVQEVIPAGGTLLSLGLKYGRAGVRWEVTALP